jgi:hypothetical protein
MNCSRFSQCLVNAHLLDARNHGSSPHSENMTLEAMSEVRE